MALPAGQAAVMKTIMCYGDRRTDNLISGSALSLPP
jgi:hypothetical protein